MKKLIILLLCCGVLVSMVGCGGNTASYRESDDNGIGNGNNRTPTRNNTALDSGRADRERKRTYPDREQGPGDRADYDRHRANNGTSY